MSDLGALARGSRLFVSMPYVEGLSPRVLGNPARSEAVPTGEDYERRQGIFRVDEIGLSVFDHGALYGDALFEGVLVLETGLFAWREHLDRLWAGAERLGIRIPFNRVALTLGILGAVNETPQTGDRAYVRLVVTRGLGDLGINPGKCLGGTVFAIAAQIQLYPEEVYQRGIALSVARKVRRPGADVLDPNVKASNYLNNIRALVETQAEGRPETLTLTRSGNIAEATADNLFLVRLEPGWERDPSHICLETPPAAYCLEGITRGIVMVAAESLGYRVVESRDMLAIDLVGNDREVFLTGTAAGLIPVVQVGDHRVGDGVPGAITQVLRGRLLEVMAAPANSLPVTSGQAEVERYFEAPSACLAAGVRVTEVER